jgi:hypothetical protein
MSAELPWVDPTRQAIYLWELPAGSVAFGGWEQELDVAAEQ